MKFNLAEVTECNSIQIRNVIIHKDAEGNEVSRTFHRSVVDSTQDLTGQPQLVQDIAVAFTKIDPETKVRPEGASEDIAMIRIMAEGHDRIRFDRAVQIVENGELKHNDRKQPEIVHALDDISELPEKVKVAARLIFTEEIKQAEVDKEVARLRAAQPVEEPVEELIGE
jgi:hypothetical protein